MTRQLAYLLVPFLTAPALARGTGAKPLTVSAAVAEALRKNPILLAAKGEADAARVQAERERPVARPTFTLEGSAMLQGPRVTFPRGTEDATVLPWEYARVGVTLEQPLYRAGLTAARTRYQASTEAAAQTTAEAALKVIRDVRKACLDLLTASAMVEAAREGLDLARAHLDMAKRMVEAGLAAARDVPSAEADVAAAEEGMIRAEGGKQLAAANLNRLLGRPLDGEVAVEPLTEQPALPPNLEAAVTDALRRRPELVLLRHQLTAALAGTTLAALQNRPAVSLRASYVQQTPTAFTHSRWYSVGLLLSWPLLDGGKAALDRQEAEAAVARLRSLLAEAESGIRLEVQTAWSALQTARARIALCQTRLNAAKSALDVSVLRYEQRSATLLEVSATRFAVTQARAALVQAENDLHAALFELQYASASDIVEATSP